jgi:uncharacterized membrane protein YoaK (UPF0700 family)
MPPITSPLQLWKQHKPEQMTNQEALRPWPITNITAEPFSRTGPTEQAGSSATHSPTIPSAVPVLLSFVAGYMDSCTFLAFNGLVVAGTTGSFVGAASELVANTEGFLVKVLAIPVFFAAGVLTTVIVRAFGSGDRRALVTTLALEAALLVGLAWIGVAAVSTTGTSIAVLFGLSAMGVQSALARSLLGQYGSTNVMTTNTTQLSIDLTEAVFARHRQQHNSPDAAAVDGSVQARSRLARLALVMLGFFAGTMAGGLAYVSTGLICLVLIIGIVAALAIWAATNQSQTR